MLSFIGTFILIDHHNEPIPAPPIARNNPFSIACCAAVEGNKTSSELSYPSISPIKIGGFFSYQ
jgi:hypothetical protein